MQIKDCFKIGFIQKPHGLKGEVTIALSPEGPDEFSKLDAVFVEQNNRLVPFFIESSSQNGDKVFAKFEDVDSSEAAEKISKAALYLPKSARPKSERGEFYDDEIIGFTAQDKQLGELGKVVSVEIAGPNKLLAVNFNDKEILIPVNGPFILSINKSKKTITVDLPEGFLDI